MRRLLASILFVAAMTSCSSGSAATFSTADPATLLPDDTTPAPGACDDGSNAIAIPTIVIGDVKTPATYGKGSLECATLAGSGFLVFSYNPVLLPADGPVQVVVSDKSTVKITWPGGDPFTQTAADTWTSATPPQGCSRLLIALKSASGQGTATYGADIQVGGSSIACPQRDLAPFDPSDTGPIPTVAS